MKQIKAITTPLFFYCDKQIKFIKDTIGLWYSLSFTIASNLCKRRRTDLNGDKKQAICVYKDAYPKATCSDIAAHFAKEWDVTVGRTTMARKDKWMSHERSGGAAKYGKLEEALMLWFNGIRSMEHQ